MVRYPVAIGFYPGNKIDLKKSIEASFLHKYGPGKLPEKDKEIKSQIAIGISPHAGYQFSGPIAANLYFSLSQINKPKTVILLGPSHYFLSDIVAIMKDEPWLTPFGEIKINNDIANKLIEDCDLIIEEPAAHAHEHSLEVQLPFLQYLYGNTFNIVPLVFGHLNLRSLESIGDTIARVISENNVNDFLIVVSSDFTHYGSGYGYTPVGSLPEKGLKWMYEMDNKAIKKIVNLDYRGFYEFVTKNNMTICGYVPITTGIIIAKQLGLGNAKLLKYATSWDTAPEYRSGSHIVGYASILIT